MWLVLLFKVGRTSNEEKIQRYEHAPMDKAGYIDVLFNALRTKEKQQGQYFFFLPKMRDNPILKASHSYSVSDMVILLLALPNPKSRKNPTGKKHPFKNTRIFF